MYEQPSPGHRVGPALVALLVVLAATAGTFGYLVTRRVADARGAAATTTTTTTTTPAGPPTSTRPAAPRTPDSTACPEVTVTAVRDAGLNADLQMLLYIRTRRTGLADSEVWICKNAGELLIYQGHLMKAPLTAAVSNNSILLAAGIKGTVEPEGTGYKATNVVGDKKTEYHVSRQVLVIRHLPQDVRERHPVVEVKP